MELIRGLYNLRPRHHGSLVTIGNFDGVHQGHQVILSQLQATGETLGLPDKVDALAAAGVARVLCVRFDEKFRALTARQFVQLLLVDGLGCRHLVIGDDFRFGCDRSGDFSVLQAAGDEFGFAVNNTDTVMVDDDRVSSTRIRMALSAGDFAQAAQLLGRPYTISGHVTHGDKIGRTLAVPTANIPSRRRVSPVHGVYAVTVEGVAAAPVFGAASVGKRPTVHGLDERVGDLLVVDVAVIC